MGGSMEGEDVGGLMQGDSASAECRPAGGVVAPSSATEERLSDEEILDIAEIRDSDLLIFSDGNELLLAATFRRFLAIQEAAAAFLAKYAALEPALNNAFAMQAVHGMPYRGETWAAELKALRDLVTKVGTPASEITDAEVQIKGLSQRE